jgi:hypothetical protein
VKGSASTLGAGSVQCKPLLFAEQIEWLSGGRSEMDSAQGQDAAAVPVGKQSEVPNLHETGRKDMKKEAPDELLAIESHETVGSLCRILGLMTSWSNQVCFSVRV